jgi:hypothetical protein
MAKRYTRKHQKMAAGRLRQILKNGRQLVRPHLVAIYNGPKNEPDQVATGFLVACKGRPILLTAKHSLYGLSGDEDPMTKSIFVNGELKFIKELKSHSLIVDPNNDIVALYVDEFPPEQCFSLADLWRSQDTPRLVTILGYLARDFKRDRRTGLHLAPYVYTNKAHDHGTGYVGLLHPKSLNRNTASGKKVMAPRPSGLSGCPMIHSEKLIEGEVRIIGIFTDQRDGIAFGEGSHKAHAMLKQLCEQFSLRARVLASNGA